MLSMLFVPIENEYARATEANLAMLTELDSLKSTSKERRDKLLKLCARMLTVCQHVKDKIAWNKVEGVSIYYPRVASMMDRGANETEYVRAIERALDNHLL